MAASPEARALESPLGPLGRRRSPPGVRAAVAGGALAGLLAAGLLIALGTASSPSGVVPLGSRGYPDWIAGPLSGLGPATGPVEFTVLFVVMCACYLAVLACPGGVGARWGLAAVVALHVVFLLGPPLLLSDVFGYIAYARLGVLHNLNPYEHGAAAAPHDPALRYVGIKDLPSPYGPLFTLASYPLAFTSLAFGLWATKLAAAVASLGSVALVWACAGRLGRPPLPPTLFVGLNPVLLVWGVGPAHNDLLMALLALAGIFLALAGREGLASGAVVAAAAVKATGGLLAPFLVAGARRRRRALAGVLLASGAVAVLVLATFGGAAAHYLAALQAQAEAVSGHSVPAELTRLAGLEVTPHVRLIAAAGFVGATLVLLVRAWRGADWITAAGWATLALLLSTTWLYPWYVALLLPLAALGESRGLRAGALALGGFFLVTRAVVLLT